MRIGYVKYRVPFIKPAFPAASVIADDYAKIVDSNWFTNFGPYEREFSQKAADYIGEDVYACSVSNATLGLFIAIQTLFDLNSDRKKILVPSFTFAAGPEMLILSGFTPVFIDIDENSWQPDLGKAEEYIRNNQDSVAGILLCNIFGVGNTSIEKWEDIAHTYNLPLIIDSAAGFGSMYREGQRVGVRGDCEIFSLHATKPLAVGEGGLIVSMNQDIIEKFKSFENFGFNHEKKIGVVGINAKMQEFNAAIGLRQLEGFDARLANRRQNLEKYKLKLASTGCIFQENDQNSTIPFVSVITESKKLTETTLDKLVQSGVEARKYYEPLHNQSALIDQSEISGELSVTEDIYDRIMSLPLHDSMSDDQIDFITDIIVQAYEKYKS